MNCFFGILNWFFGFCTNLKNLSGRPGQNQYSGRQEFHLDRPIQYKAATLDLGEDLRPRMYCKFLENTEVGSRKPEAGKQEAGSRKPEPEARSRKLEAGSRKPEAGSRMPEAGNRKPEAGSRKPEAGSRKPDFIYRFYLQLLFIVFFIDFIYRFYL